MSKFSPKNKFIRGSKFIHVGAYDPEGNFFFTFIKIQDGLVGFLLVFMELSLILPVTLILGLIILTLGLELGLK